MAATAVSPLPKTCSRLLRSLIVSVSQNNAGASRRGVSTISTSDPARTKTRSSHGTSTKAVTISRAMKLYMEKVREYDDMMKAEVADYEIGKRHLANIMGENPDTFTQADVDRAISYLLPSGIFDKKARPMMKHPSEIFPQRKAAQFGLDGRPHHSMYFTTKANYYNILYDINWKSEDLKQAEDDFLRKEEESKASIAAENEEFKTYTFSRSEWIKREQLEKIVLEKISDTDYQHFVVLMERLASHPLSHMEQEFIMKFREMMDLQSVQMEIPQIERDSDGRSFARAEGVRKHAKAWVKVYKPGTGKVEINGTDLSFFSNNLHRENLMSPLSVCGLVGEVDLVAEVETKHMNKIVYNNMHAPNFDQDFNKGPTGQSGAIRLGLARALTAFIEPKLRDNLRLTGLLTPDPRVKERKKPGQEGARKKFTWKKR